MLIEEMQFVIPQDWVPMDLVNEKYKIVPVVQFSAEYQKVLNLLNVRGCFNNHLYGVFRVQNPYLYTKFRLKMYDFSQKGAYDIKFLFHDTSTDNALSISQTNFDWRYGQRFKYGPGVYFSTSPMLANKHSSNFNGKFRSMFIAEVLTQNVQRVNGDVFLPDFGFDTINCHHGNTYVKYFDAEYYPLYFVNYVC